MMRPSEAAPFHISNLEALQPLIAAFSGTCLAPQLPENHTIDFAGNSALFTGESAPRNVSAYSGLGATIDVTTEEGATQLIDLCSMTENTVLGLNDPWVKLKQTSYLLSSRPHHVTIRLGCDLYYRIGQRILRCFEKVSNKGDFVINIRECTGSGAVDLALHSAVKAAKSPARRKLASFKGSFHGSNLGPILASDHQPLNGSGRIFVEKADNVELFPIPQVNQEGELTESALKTLSTLERDGDLYFAVILEPIPWRNSLHVVPTLFLQRLREICTRKSICLIFDEVQNGFGYTGTICFAEICGVCPDISVFGKGLTSGHGALSIIVAKRAFKEHEPPFGFKSNSSNMLPLVAVDAVLDRLLGLDPEEAKMLPEWLPSELATELQTGLLSTTFPRTVAMIDELFAELQRRFPSLIGASKGMGLMRGLVILGADGQPSSRLAAEAAKICMNYGVHFRQADTAIFIKPCIVLTKAEVDRALIGLSRTFEDLLRIRDEITSFQLSSLDALRPLIESFSSTCLDPAFKTSPMDPEEHFASNPTLFTTGGSWPRDVWAKSGIGGTLDASVVATGAPLPLIDLCTISTVLGVNDPWVKLKQTAYLLSSHPHHVTIRLGCDMYYRVARRILRCFDEWGKPGDFVINLRQCNGSDGVELAIHSAWKAAAQSPTRRKLATFHGSYHGENLTASLISDHQPQHGSGRLLLESAENVTFFPSPECGEDDSLSPEAFETLSILERDGDQYFAIILEPIQWRNSVHAMPIEFLRRLRDVCTRKSICLIFDEIHNAFGYLGTISYVHYAGVCPDITVISKGLTSGHGSLAVTIAKKTFKEVEGTFAGKSNAAEMLTLVAIDAVLDRLLGMDPKEAQALPPWLPSKLKTELHTGLLTTAYPRTVAMIDEMFEKLQRRFPTLIGASTGLGLVRGLVILGADGQPSSRLAAEVAKGCLVHGVHVRNADTALFIKPSIVLTQTEVDAALLGLSRTFEDVTRICDETNQYRRKCCQP